MAPKRIYLDSNVFISYVRQEMGKNFRFLGSEAQRFFAKCPNRHVLVLSDLFFREVKRAVLYDRVSTYELLEEMLIDIEVIFPDKVVRSLEHMFAQKGIHYPDSLHAAQAVASKCDFLVTFNKKDFAPASSKIAVLSPEELSY